MDNIKELNDILPQIIIYIVTGFVFNKTFHFVALRQNTSDIEHILTSSLVIGYVYCNIAYLIPISISYEVDTVLIVCSALVLGYLCARIFRTKKLVYIYDFLKIRDTGNLYYWDDIMDDDYPMKVSISFENIEYEGMLHNFESYSNEPHLVLASYIIKDKNGQIVKDCTNDTTRITVLNISDAISVDVLYDKNSGECEDIQQLCKYNKNIKK